MPEEVWTQAVLDAAKAAEPLQGDMTPSPLHGARQAPETEESQVPADIPEDEGPAGTDSGEGVTQADPEPKDATAEDLEQDLDGDSDCDRFPMVRREDQHAFKESKGKIQKMDEGPAAPVKPTRRGKARTAMKRPAARAPPQGKRSKMAEPVEVVALDSAPSDSDGAGSDPRQNLSGAFEAAALEAADSAQPPHTFAPKAKTKSARPRSAAKSRSEPKRVQTAGSRADGDTGAEKKRKRRRLRQVRTRSRRKKGRSKQAGKGSLRQLRVSRLKRWVELRRMVMPPARKLLQGGQHRRQEKQS